LTVCPILDNKFAIIKTLNFVNLSFGWRRDVPDIADSTCVYKAVAWGSYMTRSIAHTRT